MERKQEIRKEFLKKRNAMSREERKENSDTISELGMLYFEEYDNVEELKIYGYYPTKSEVSLIELYQWMLDRGMELAFPRVDGDAMDFYQIESIKDFTKGAFGIYEPVMECQKVEWENAICLVPGAVFDKKGHRYGYGAGYYDRYFHRFPDLYKIGVCFAEQITGSIPMEETDISMDALMCEQGITETED